MRPFCPIIIFKPFQVLTQDQGIILINIKGLFWVLQGRL